MIRDRLSKAEAEAIRLQDSCWLDTILFFRYTNVLCRLFDKWKDNDSFYFIPLKLDMSYHIGGHTISMAEGPIFLGTFIRNTLEHEELFSIKCPRCGKFARFDYDRMAATAFRAYRGASQMYKPKK